MKAALFTVCLIGVALLSAGQAHAQQLVIGGPAPVYATPVYPTVVYPSAYSVPAYATTYYAPAYSVPAYSLPTNTVYYSAPAAVYAAPAPYAVSAPVVVGAPVRVHGYWGRHHGHVSYRW